MGTTLTGTTPQDTYDSLIKVTDNGPLSGTAKYLSDGLGNDSVLAVSTSRVGIGTTSPDTALDVNGGSKFRGSISGFGGAEILLNAGNNSQVALSTNGTGTTEMYFDQRGTATGIWRFRDTGDTRMSLTSVGLGIGISSPSQKLHVAGGNLLVNNGTSPDSNSGIRIVAPISTTQYNWMIAAQQNLADEFEITPSTAVGGTTFSAPILSANAISKVVTIASGIKFPATQVSSANANTLDDYEEGTWTATLTDGTTTKTASCSYTKIGRMVYLAGGISNVEDPSAFTGNVYITGVPFVPAFSVSLYGFNNYLSTASVFTPYLESNQVIRFYKVGAASADNVQMQGSDLDFYSDIYFAGQFTV